MVSKPSVRTHRQLQANVGNVSSNDQNQADLIETVYRLRVVPFAGTSLNINGGHLGALIKLTNAAAVTITVPAAMSAGKGFLTNILALGAGGATITGTHVGGSTVAQNGLATIMTLDDGSWFVTGAA